jgi:hypothetical protein
MKVKKISGYSILITAIVFNLSAISVAGEIIKKPVINIPVLEDAQIFADFTDVLPAVVNYYTLATEEQITTYYSQHFGVPILQENTQKYLTLLYQQEQKMMRVVISQQQNQRQIDIIIE